jgi:hypothetical protein
MLRHGERTWLGHILVALAAIFTCVFLFMGWVVLAIFAMGNNIHPIAVMATIPVVAYLILRTARAFDASGESGREDPFTPFAGTVNWKLRDPMLSTFGVWRADVKCHPTDIDGFDNRKMVNDYIRCLVHHWSIRSAWPCKVLRLAPAKERMSQTSGAGSRAKAYQITLADQWDGIRRGKLCLGDGFAEFQVEAFRPQEFPAEEPVDVDDPKRFATREFSHASSDTMTDSLWDRWLDG